MTGPHPKSLDDGWIPDIIDAVKEVFSRGVTFVRRVHGKYLLVKDGEASVVDYEDLPEDEQKERRHQLSKESLSRNPSLKSSREAGYKGQSPSKIANRATDNPYILSDILDDPGLVDADGETEAIAKVAENNPGWAKMSDAVEAHGLEADVDGNVSPSGESTGESGGESTGAAEAASEAAIYSGDVSTADAGDLGPTGSSGYGLDAGGSSGSGDVGGGTGGDAGGGDVGGGDL